MKNNTPTKRPKNFDAVDCTVDELWTAFVAAPDPVEYTQVHKILIAQGRACSYDWVKKKCSALGFAKKKRLQMTLMMDPTDLDEKRLIALLNAMGKEFNPMESLQGLQSRIVAMLSIQISAVKDPNYFIGMMEAYTAVTRELQRTYQYRVKYGKEDVAGESQSKTASSEVVTPFKKRSE